MAERDVTIGTRVFGKLGPEKYAGMLNPFLENAKVFGPCLVVSQKDYEHLSSLTQFVEGHAELRLSETKGNESPADMCNQIVKYCADKNLAYFGIVSSDFSHHIPRVMPELIDRLTSDPQLTTVGVAIEGVHDLEVLKTGITTENYATVFHNNAFSVQRLNVPGVTLEQRLFPRESDQFRLGSVKIGGKDVPVGGNEEIALVLRLLGQGTDLNVKLLAGKHTIVRDAGTEISSIEEKVKRRSQVAKVYQEHFGITDERLRDYLSNHYKIID